MALTRSLTLYVGENFSPAIDYTDDTIWPDTELASMANLGEASAGQVLIRDPLGVIPDDLGLRYLNAHNVMIATVGSNTLWRGRIAGRERYRGPRKAGRASEWNITVEDANSHLRGIAITNWSRPEETDVDRALGLVAAFLTGSPRATTALATNLIISSNTIALPAKMYTGVTPFEVMQELAANTDKEVFVTVDTELAYFGHDYLGYASGLRISDDPADANATTFAPWNPRATEWSRGLLSGLRTYYGTDPNAGTLEVTNTNAALHDYWQEVFWDSESTTLAQSQARGQKMLDYRGIADVSFSCSIGPMTGERTAEIKPGQLIQFKARAARSGRSSAGAFTGDSFLTTRIRDLRWTMPNEDQYIARLELERPKRIMPASKGSQALTQLSPTQVGQGVCLFPDGDWLPGSGAGPCEETIGNLPGDPSFTSVVCLGSTSLGWAEYDNGEVLPRTTYGIYSGRVTLPTIVAGDRHFLYFFVGDALPLRDGSGNHNALLVFSRNPTNFTGLKVNEGDPDEETYASILSGAVNWKLKVDAATTMFKVWVPGAVEPDWEQGTDVVAGTQRYLSIEDVWQGTPDPPVGKFTAHSSVKWCSDAPVAFYGRIYGPVLVAIADGVDTSWTLPYPTSYVSGTLDVRVDGTPQTATEISPSAGTFSLSFVPAAGDEISAVWLVPNTI